jgi:hypothetical protein
MKIVCGVELASGDVVSVSTETDDDCLVGLKPTSVVVRSLMQELGDRLAAAIKGRFRDAY